MAQTKCKKNLNKEDALSSLKISSSGTKGTKLSKYTTYRIESDELEFTIARRYNDFKWLRNLLLTCYPGFFVPPLPPAIVWGRFEESFIEKRRHELETFLLRIRNVEPFTKSDIYQCFMSCDDKEFINQKTEIDSNPTTTNPHTALLTLQTVYPTLKDDIPDTEAKHFKRLQKRLQSIHEQMKVLDIRGAKICNYFKNISKELPLYLNALRTLHSHEMKSELFQDSEDTPNEEPHSSAPLLPKYTLFFEQVCEYHHKIADIFDEVFLSNVTVQHKDIIAFLEIFKQYEQNRKFHERLSRAVEKWETLEHMSAEKNIALKPKQAKQKDADCNSKQDVFELLEFTRKVVLKESVSKFARYKVKCWEKKINQFYTIQCGLHQMTRRCNIQNVHNAEEAKESEPESTQSKNALNEEKMQRMKDENKTLYHQNKQLRKQIKILAQEVEHLRNETVAQNIEIRSHKNKDESVSHQYDVFPSLSDIMQEYERIKHQYVTQPSKFIVRDVKKQYMNHGDAFVIKLAHEVMFDILFAAHNKMKEYEFDFYMKASKLFYIQDMDVLKDLCRDQLRKTYLHMFNEIKHNYVTDVLDIIVSSYTYSFSSESKQHLMSFIEASLKICWQLILSENGHLRIKPKLFDFETRSQSILYEPDMYDAYFGSNLRESMNYILWPSIYDTINNEPITKIYAMFANTIPKFSEPFIRKKLKQTQQDLYDTIRIVTEPEGASHLPSNDSSKVRHILARQEANLYKVYVGIRFGYKELSVGYVDNHNKKKLHPIFKQTPSIVLNAQNELKGVGTSAFDTMNDTEQYYTFDNFMIALHHNKMVQIENEYDNIRNEIDYKQETVHLKDKNGKTVEVAVLLDVVLHFLWKSTFDIIKKSYEDRFNEEIQKYEIEWKVSVPDMIYAFCKPLLRSSGITLGLSDNLILIRESQAIAITYSIKLPANDKFMSIILNEYSLIIACYKKTNEYKIKELTSPKVNKNVCLHRVTNQFVTLLTDILHDDDFDQWITSKPDKMNEIKVSFLKAIKATSNNGTHAMSSTIFSDVLNTIFQEIDKLLTVKQLMGCKQHVIIGGELCDIEYIQNTIRDKYRNDPKSKINANNIHFARTTAKIVKGAALYDVVTPKHNILTYRANKSWGISVQRDYMEGRDDKNKRVFNEINETWSVNGVFYEIIKKGQMVQANHCKVIWVQPIHASKIQIDVYSSGKCAGSKESILYVEECQYEGSQSFELLSEWKNQNEIPLVFWCDVQENNKIRLHICINDLNQATSRIIDLTWTVKK
eukprot:30265_1